MKFLTLRAAKQDAEGALIVQRYATFEILTVGGQSGVDRVPGVVNGDGVPENPITANIAGLAKVGAPDGDYDVLKTNPDGSTERETVTWFDGKAARDVTVAARDEAIQAQSDVADMAAQMEADADRAEIARVAAEARSRLRESQAAAEADASITTGSYYGTPISPYGASVVRLWLRTPGGSTQQGVDALASGYVFTDEATARGALIGAAAAVGTEFRYYDPAISGEKPIVSAHLTSVSGGGASAVDSRTPSAAAVVAQSITSGELYATMTTIGSVTTGGVFRADGGRNVGVTAPAGQTAANSYLDPQVAISDVVATALVALGAQIRIKVSADVSANLSAVKPLNSSALNARGTGTTQFNVGAMVRNEQIGTVLYREYVYTPTAADRLIEPVLQWPNNSPAISGADHFFQVRSLVWTIESVNGISLASLADFMLDRRLDPLRSAIESNAANLSVNAAAIAAINDAIISSYSNRGEITQTNAWGTGTYNQWFFGGDVGTEITVTPGQSLTHLYTALRTYGTTTRKVRLTVLLRDLASGVLNTAGQQSGDVAYGPYTFDLSTVSAGALPATNTTAFCRLAIGTGIPQSALNGKRVYFFIEGLDAAKALSALGTGYNNTYSGSVDQGKRGYFGTGNLAASIGSPNRASWRVEQSVVFSAAVLTAKVDPTITPNFLLPDKLWLTAGRPVPFAWDQMASQRIDASVFEASLQSLKYLPTTPQANAPKIGLSLRTSGGAPMLDPDAVGSSIVVTIRRRGVADTRYRKSIAASVAAWTQAGKAPVILGLGDSLAAQSKLPALYMELIARGMSPNFIGDLPRSFNGVAGGTANTEGRPGKAMADYIYARVYNAADGNTMKPCVGDGNAISYASYLALPDSGNAGVDAKQNRNPFLVAGSGTSYNNGYKWSLAQYLSYTGKAAPTHVLISLGTNDIFQFSQSVALANITAGIQLMVSEIRAAAPNAYICFYSDACGWRDGINDSGQYYANHFAMMQTQQAAVKTLIDAGDTRLTCIPLGLHEDGNSLGLMTLQSTDSYGLQTIVDDAIQAGYVHPTDTNILHAAASLASWVAATA